MNQINKAKLKPHIDDYIKKTSRNPAEAASHLKDRRERSAFYKAWSKERMLKMEPDDIYEYLSKLFAMLIWGNKQYYVDKLMEDNGLEHFRSNLAKFVWGSDPVDRRWDVFRREIKGLGPAIMSEILCYVYSDDCMLWNRRAYVGFDHLGVSGLPKYNYQFTGKVYVKLSSIAKQIANELKVNGIEEPNLLAVDYFIWDELQVQENLNKIFKKDTVPNDEESAIVEEVDGKSTEFIHDEIKDKIAEIGAWLGFKSSTEKKVADGSKVDAIWESTIGNMGRVIYVFEVQTKGSIDSLILNLLKSINNPAVQGVVAVSDSKQIEKIKKHCFEVTQLQTKIRYWNYKEVLEVHANLERVNESINSLNLVPDGFAA